MKLHFESDLDYQLAAMEAVCDLFRGQETCRTEFTVIRDPADAQQRMGFAENDLGIGNRLTLLDDELLRNLNAIQLRNGLPPSASLASGDFTVEMETGTGKTYHTRWPEALVVYPQGLNTPGRLTDPQGKKPGWQARVGDQSDRDLKFFDAMLESFKRDYRVDEKRIYATGHSNGGGFTYLLWAARGDTFAAFAPSAAAGAAYLRSLKPKPVLHVAGESDPLVKFAWQKQTMDTLRQINQCGDGQPWEKWGTLYPSKTGAPVVTFIQPGGHEFLAEAPTAIVKFFKEHAKP